MPTDFESVVFADPALEIPGEIIGPSVRLLCECERLASALQIPPDVDPWAEDDDLYLLLDTQGEQGVWHGFGVESFTCVGFDARLPSVDSFRGGSRLWVNLQPVSTNA